MLDVVLYRKISKQRTLLNLRVGVVDEAVVVQIKEHKDAIFELPSEGNVEIKKNYENIKNFLKA